MLTADGHFESSHFCDNNDEGHRRCGDGDGGGRQRRDGDGGGHRRYGGGDNGGGRSSDKMGGDAQNVKDHKGGPKDDDHSVNPCKNPSEDRSVVQGGGEGSNCAIPVENNDYDCDDTDDSAGHRVGYEVQVQKTSISTRNDIYEYKRNIYKNEGDIYKYNRNI